MKFTQIRLIGASTVDLPLVGLLPSNPYILKAADGLGPVEVDVSITNTLTQGGVYQGRRPQLREVVLRVGVNPGWHVGQTAEQLRTTLYGLLTPKYGNPVRMQLMDGTIALTQNDCYVKKFEVAIFSKDPEVQITLGFAQPYLLSPTVSFLSPAKTISGGYTNFDIVNPGTAPSGFQLFMEFTAATGATLQLSDDNPFGEMLSLTKSFAVGDKLRIDTRAGQRGIWKTPAGGSENSIINALNPTTDWLQLSGGTNHLKINNTAFDWYISGVVYTPAYWGV